MISVSPTDYPILKQVGTRYLRLLIYSFGYWRPFRMRLYLVVLTVPLCSWAAEDPYAAQLFQKHCAKCHESADANGRIPQVSVLKSMTPAAIQKTLDSGIMKTQAAALSPDERLRVASFLGTAVTLERKHVEIANSCRTSEQSRVTASWASWGGGLANTRFQPAKDAGIEAQDVPHLALKWAFAFSDTSTLRSQP